MVAPKLDKTALNKVVDGLHKELSLPSSTSSARFDPIALFRVPDEKKIQSLLQPLTSTDRQAVEKLYQQNFAPKGPADALQQQLQKELKPGDWLKVQSTLEAADGRTNDAGELHQLVYGLNHGNKNDSRSQIVQVLSTLNSEQMTQLDRDYRQNYGQGFADAINGDNNSGDLLKQALPLLIKGSDKRSADDDVALAKMAVRDAQKTVAAIGPSDPIALLHSADNKVNASLIEAAVSG
ncbi:MAG: hypothetical protein ACRD3W_08950, partial [Terriglobales bacterium]